MTLSFTPKPLGLYAAMLPPPSDTRIILADALAEMNRTQGTLTDEQMASVLQRILARKGFEIARKDS